MRPTMDSVSRAKDYASSKFTLLKTHYIATAETYNTISQIPKHVRQAICAEGELLINAPQWCEEIWKTMRKTDFATQGTLTIAILENIYQLHQKKFEKLVGTSSLQELMSLMDADHDGLVNEDEQILIFSIVKEKLVKLSENLNNIQEYTRYRDVMKAVRKLEGQIAKYQDFLRKRIYASEIDVYHQIGEARFDEFYAYYEQKFMDFNTYSLEREENLRTMHEEQLNNLIDSLDRDAVALKFKPKIQLKEYQRQEKLVSIDERVEEAMNFRKELKDLEVSEAQRVNKLRIENMEKQKNELIAKQNKEMSHLQSKLKNEENKLIIKMKVDFDVLMKKNHLHENEIKKIQGLAAKFAMQKALNDGELRRMKDKSKKMNELLKETKRVSSSSPSMRSSPGNFNEKVSKKNSEYTNSLSLAGTDMQNKTAADFVRSIIKSPNVIRFNLKKGYGEEPPVNAQRVKYADEDKLSHKKVEIYLKNKAADKKNEIPQLTSLYDDQLRLIEKNEDKYDKTSVEEKKRTRQFINDKLNGDKKVVF